MSGFNDFISLELPKRPFVENDGQAGQMLVRSSNPLAARQLVWADAATGTGSGTPAVHDYISRVNVDLVTMWKTVPVMFRPDGNMSRASCTDLVGSTIYGGLAFEDAGIPVGSSGRVLTSGVLTAQTSEWDNTTGTVGGLVPGLDYFVLTTGKLTWDSSLVTGTLQCVGTALSATELLLKTNRPIFL